MKQDRFLVGILVGIALLVIIALVVFFTRQDTLSYGPEDSPGGVVRNYVVAIYNRNYEKAYSYLAEDKDKPTYETFRESFVSGMVYPQGAGIEIGTTEQLVDDEAIVTVSVVYNAGDPFSSGYRNADRAVLIKQDGNWKLKQMPSNNFWSWEWYQATVEPAKP
jgi:hypothetical protein